jgi:very-short-patch-repair endonuclease
VLATLPYEVRSKSNADVRSARAWTLARRQHGVLTRRQLLGLGFGAAAIEHRVANGRLHPVLLGIYAVGRPQLTREGRWMAAVLACGEGAALSHGSAAALWGIERERGGAVDVSVRSRTARRRQGIRARRRPALPRKDVVERNRIPVTRPARTLVDLATERDARRLERAVNEADKLDLIDPETLRAALDGYAGEPGVAVLRNLLDPNTFRLSDGELERLFRPIALAAGLPQPQTKVWVSGFEVDFFWPDLGLVVETDGLHYHRTPMTQTRDRRRDQAHTAAGLTQLRFTHWQVAREPAYVQGILSQVTRRSGGRGTRRGAGAPADGDDGDIYPAIGG